MPRRRMLYSSKSVLRESWGDEGRCTASILTSGTASSVSCSVVPALSPVIYRPPPTLPTVSSPCSTSPGTGALRSGGVHVAGVGARR